MNKKVEELVERVAKQLDEVFSALDHYDCSEECGHRVGLSEWRDSLVKQILSHPDLALIDRKKLPNELDCVDCPTPEGRECYQCYIYEGFGKAIQAGYLPIIPLAEELKEKE